MADTLSLDLTLDADTSGIQDIVTGLDRAEHAAEKTVATFDELQKKASAGIHLDDEEVLAWSRGAAEAASKTVQLSAARDTLNETFDRRLQGENELLDQADAAKKAQTRVQALADAREDLNRHPVKPEDARLLAHAKALKATEDRTKSLTKAQRDLDRALKNPGANIFNKALNGMGKSTDEAADKVEGFLSPLAGAQAGLGRMVAAAAPAAAAVTAIAAAAVAAGAAVLALAAGAYKLTKALADIRGEDVRAQQAFEQFGDAGEDSLGRLRAQAKKTGASFDEELVPAMNNLFKVGASLAAAEDWLGVAADSAAMSAGKKNVEELTRLMADFQNEQNLGEGHIKRWADEFGFATQDVMDELSAIRGYDMGTPKGLEKFKKDLESGIIDTSMLADVTGRLNRKKAEGLKLDKDNIAASMAMKDPSKQFLRVGEAWDEMKSRFAQAALSPKALDGIQKLTDKAIEWIEKLTSEENMAKVTKFVDDMVDSLSGVKKASAKDGEPTFFDDLFEFGRNTVKTVEGIMFLADAFGMLDKEAEEGAEGPSTWTKAMNIAKDAMWNMVPGVGAVRAGWDLLKGGMAMTAGFVPMVDRVAKSTMLFASETADAFELALQAAEDWFGQTLPKVKEWAGGVWSGIKDAFTGAGTALVQVGKDILGGLEAGFDAAWKGVKDKVMAAFDQLPAGVKKLLGIGSPSKVFASLGGFTAQGYGIGFAKEIGEVDVQGMLEEATDVRAPAVDIPFVNGDVPATPRPTNDNSQIQRTVPTARATNDNSWRAPAPAKNEVIRDQVSTADPIAAANQSAQDYYRERIADDTSRKTISLAADGTQREDGYVQRLSDIAPSPVGKAEQQLDLGRTVAERVSGSAPQEKLPEKDDSKKKLKGAIQEAKSAKAAAPPVNITFAPTITLDGNATPDQRRATATSLVDDLAAAVRRKSWSAA